MSVEESWRLRELEIERVEERRRMQRKILECLRMQKDDGIVEVQGVLGVF